MARWGFVFIILLFSCLCIHAQTVRGYVFDKGAEEPIQGVTVYFDGSSIGTVTNDKGYFELTTASQMSSTLIVSYMGYETIRITDAYSAQLFKIYLTETAFGLDEIVLKPDPFTREQKLRVFKQQFLGRGYEGVCTIANEDAITVTYNMNNSTLLAYANAPLQITNSYLGYDVTYNLVDFKATYTRNTLAENALTTVFFAGTSFFKDVSEGKGRYVRRREDAYLGSSLHFLRTVANNSWDNEKFGLFKGSFPADPRKEFTITDTLGYKQLTATEKNWNILYRKDKQSRMQLQLNAIYIDNYGCFFPVEGVLFSGYMGSLRFKEMLPLDYYPSKKK